MNELIEIYNMLTKLISSRNTRKSSEFKLYVDDIFEKTETILKNYLDMFSAIRINIISGKLDIDDIVNYLLHIPDNQRSRPDWTARDSV